MEMSPLSWKSQVVLQVYLVDHEKNEIVWDSGSIASAIPAAPNLEDAVQNMGVALQQIFAQIAEGLRRKLQ
jgi:hypothetical protein